MRTSITRYKCQEPGIIFNHVILERPYAAQFQVHVHDVCEMIYLVSGNVSAVVEEKSYKLPHNSVVFFRANVPHRIRIENDDEPYERYDIIFDENALANRIFFDIPKTLDVLTCAGSERVADLFKKLDYYPKHFEGAHLDKLMTGVIEEILYNLYLQPDASEEEPMLTVHPLIGSAVAYINEHYKEPITVDDICANLNITKSYLHRLFMDEMKISPKKYVNVRRLAKAQKMIRNGGKPSHIYSECGFLEYATFFRNYTDYFGYAPSQENMIEIERKIES